MRDEMKNYIRNTMELNHSLYEITNSSNVSNDMVADKEVNKEKEKSGKHNGLYKEKELEKGIKKFKNTYERFEDKLIVSDMVNTVWETGEKVTEIASVNLSSNFIGSKANGVYFVTKSLFITSHCCLTVACWAVISTLYKLKSLIKSVI